MFCKNCGSNINPGARFCTSCGTPTENNSLDHQQPVVNNIESDSLNYQQPVVNDIKSDSLNYQQSVTSYENKKSNNKTVFWIILVLVIAALSIFGLFKLSQSLISDMFSSGEIGLEELKLKDVSFTYDSSIWPYKASTTNNTSSVGVSKSNCLVGLMYSKNDYYITTEAFAKQHKDSYINQGYTIVEDLEKITINGNEWFKLVVNEPNSTALQLFFVKGYDAYSFTYKAVSSDYHANLQHAQEVYNTLKYDNSSDLASQQNGKRQLIGEWDWDRSGYVVANSDQIYVYRDSSKDPQNVYYGTYVVYDRIMTYGEGYIEGLYLMINVERSIINGQVSDEKYQLEFALIPNNDGTYTLKKIGYDAQVIVRKVK
ncbi:MAG: zinc ribbon domain-containing protein [Bacilli bacterium]|nr:zinc ribbon domain-containing protein [Bacilli bacterium]